MVCSPIKFRCLETCNGTWWSASNAFYVNQTNNYVEISAGLENIFKLFRVDVIGSYLNGRSGQVGVRVGFDGLFGTAIGNALKNPSAARQRREDKYESMGVWEYGGIVKSIENKSIELNGK